MSFLQSMSSGLYATFIYDDRWTLFVRGIGYTLLISLFAVLFGLIIGLLAALGRLSKIKIFNWIAGIYIDVIRGTPTMVQVLIFYFVILAGVRSIPAWFIGVIAFSINSGAYIAEIVRGGILSINKGQTEAGRSLGLTQAQTMRLIILPQTLKNILPALVNEFIVLIKETAVIGMINNIDLLGAAKKVQTLTYDFLWPLVSCAVIYYVIIKIFSMLLASFEKKLRASDKR